MSRRIYRIPTENNSGYQMLDMEEYHDAFPRPEVDGIPMQPPIGYKREDPLHVKIRNMLLSEKLRQEASEGGFETPEEADDFDVDDPDDYNPPALAEETYRASQELPYAGPQTQQNPPPAAPPADGPPSPPPAPKPEPAAS